MTAPLIDPHGHRARRRRAFWDGARAMLAHRLLGHPGPRCPHSRASRVGQWWARGALQAEALLDQLEGSQP